MPRAAEHSALGPANNDRKGIRRLKTKSLTVTTTGDCCLQGNPNGPKHPEMLGEGVTCQNSHPLKMLGKSALPSGDGKPKDACNEGFLPSRPVTCMGKASLGKL